MTIQLGDSIVAGHIDGSDTNSVHGWLQLTDRKHPVLLHLTGNLKPPWRGRQIFFQSKDHLDWQRPLSTPSPKRMGYEVASHQIGPLFDFHLLPKGDFNDPSVAESEAVDIDLFADVGVHLEWFGQDGRIVVAIARAFVKIGGPWMGPQWAGANPFVTPVPDAGEQDGADQRLDEQSLADAMAVLDDGDTAINQADQIDAVLSEHFALVDEMVEGNSDVPLRTLFDPPLKLPPEFAMTDKMIAYVLLPVLAELAVRGIGLDICEHFSPRQTYELLENEILDARVFPRLAQTGFIQQFTTYPYCERCAEPGSE